MSGEIIIPASSLGKLIDHCTQNQLNPTSTVKIVDDGQNYKLFTRQEYQHEFILAGFTAKPVQPQSAKTG